MPCEAVIDKKGTLCGLIPTADFTRIVSIDADFDDCAPVNVKVTVELCPYHANALKHEEDPTDYKPDPHIENIRQ